MVSFMFNIGGRMRVQMVFPRARSTRNACRPAGQVLILAVLGMVALAACTPTIRVATDEPITINLNVNIKHEILVKVDRELDDLFSKDSDLF